MTIICGFVSGTAVEIASYLTHPKFLDMNHSLIKKNFMENHEDSIFFPDEGHSLLMIFLIYIFFQVTGPLIGDTSKLV